MSDGSASPGWWLASDGRWYPPERHADPEHRARYATPPVAPPVQPSAFAPPDGGSIDHRPTTTTAPTPPVAYPHTPPVPPVARPPEQWPPATRLVEPRDTAAGLDRILLGVALVAALVVIVGSFLPWARFAGAATGDASAWDRHSDWANDGLLVTIGGIVALTACAPLLVGARHLILRLGLLAGGLTAFTVFLVDAIDTRREDRARETVEIGYGIGLWLVGVAATVLVVAALVHRGSWRWNPDRP